jgi:hypothetical protein
LYEKADGRWKKDKAVLPQGAEGKDRVEQSGGDQPWNKVY